MVRRRRGTANECGNSKLSRGPARVHLNVTFLTAMNKPKHSEYFEEFSNLISKRSDYKKWKLEYSDRASLRYPSTTKEVGDIVIYDDQNELTLAVEEIYHTHFNPEFGPSYDWPVGEKDTVSIAKEAVKFIDSILNNRLVMWICYLDERPFSAGACPIEEIKEFVPEDAVCYLWSGKFVPER